MQELNGFVHSTCVCIRDLTQSKQLIRTPETGYSPPGSAPSPLFAVARTALGHRILLTPQTGCSLGFSDPPPKSKFHSPNSNHQTPNPKFETGYSPHGSAPGPLFAVERTALGHRILLTPPARMGSPVSLTLCAGPHLLCHSLSLSLSLSLFLSLPLSLSPFLSLSLSLSLSASLPLPLSLSALCLRL